jgi:signal transduction histidine kinase
LSNAPGGGSSAARAARKADVFGREFRPFAPCLRAEAGAKWGDLSRGARGGFGRARGTLFEGRVRNMSETESRAEGGASAQGEEQLRRAVAEREARLAEFADLAARVRHEINNPLTGLIGQAQLLLREELSEAARRRVLTIEQLANRIRDTVASLREIQTPLPSAHTGELPPLPGEPPRH